MRRNLMCSTLLIFVLVGLSGCFAAAGKNQKTFVNLSEINAKIHRTGKLSTVLEKNNAGKAKEEKQPVKKVFTVAKGAKNKYLKSFVPTEPAAPKALAGEGILLNFDNADIYEVIQSIAEILNINYIIDPQVKGTVNIRSGKKIPLRELFPIFKKILEINGLDIRSEGDYQYIYVAKKHVSQLIRGPKQIGELKESPRMVMQIVPLEHMSSAQAEKLVKPFLSDQGQIYNMQNQNLLIITDFESKVIDCVDMLDKLDISPLGSLKVEMVRITNAPLYDLKDDLDDIMKALQVNQKDFQGITILPLARLNSLLLVGKSQSALDTVETWIHQLDVLPTEGRDNVYIYNVRNSVASELADLVNSLISSKGGESRTVHKETAAPPATTRQRQGSPGVGTTAVTSNASHHQRRSGGVTPASGMQFSGVPVLIADDSRNVILIRALPPDYRRIQTLLERLDNMPRQVLIEVMVAEVNLTDQWSMGVEWWAKNRSMHLGDHHLNQDYGFNLTNSPFDTLDPTNPLALPGFTYSLLSDSQDIYGLLNLLATDDNIKILSSPQVLVLNNQTATVNVGNQVPIVTSQFTDTVGSTTSNQTIQYKDTGIILNVTPRINYDGIVLIDIDQQVSSVVSQTTQGINSPTISTKEVKTKLAVKNGQSILIGGLISRNKSDNETGIPLIKDLPILGNLFKYQSKQDDRTELLLVITPYVIENENVLDQYIQQFKKKTQEIRDTIYGTHKADKTAAKK